MMGYGMMSGYGFGLNGLIINIAMIAGTVWLIVWAVRRFASGTSRESSGGQAPRDILQVRYARGEITRDQYQEILKDLG